MKDTYIIIIVVVAVAILGFVFASKKGGAPVVVEDNTQMEVEASSLQDGTYTVDTSKSYITWRGEFVTGNGHDGKVMLKDGSATVANADVVSGNFAIDLNTIVDNDNTEKLITHLKGADFFDVATYPTANFELKSFELSNQSSSANRYIVSGNLTLKDKTMPVSFIADIANSGENTMVITGNFAINRADWEMKYNSTSFFSGLGDKAIRDAVEIGLNIVVSK